MVLAAEPAGSHCTYGGTKYTSGLDLNGDGILQAGEVTNTSYTCTLSKPVSLIGLQSPASPAPTIAIAATDGYGVILDGSSSFSPDGTGCGPTKTLTYRWSFVSTPPAASNITFNDPTRVNPTFYPTVSGTYVVGLTVNDCTTSSNLSTVAIITADQASGVLDFVAVPGVNQLPGGTHRYNTFRVPAGSTVVIDPAGTQYLDLRVNGDVFIGGSIDVSGSAGGDGPAGDVSWQGAGGGQTGYPFKQGVTPTPGGGCSSTFGGPNVAIPAALGGQGSAGAQGASGLGGSTCGGGLGGANGGGMGGGPGAGGGGGFAGGGGGGGNTCNSAGVSTGGNGGGSFAGAGGGAAQGGGGGNGGGSPYNGTAGTSVMLGNCGAVGAAFQAGGGYGAGGGGGSIGVTAAQDLSMLSTFQTGSAGGGGAGDEGRGGGGGGGAVRIISNGSIVVSGSIMADGGRGGDSGGDPNCCQGGSGGGGSGGAIWLSAPTVYNAGYLWAAGGRGGIAQTSRGTASGNGGPGGLGRIRIASPAVTSYGIVVPALPVKLDGTGNAAGSAFVTPIADDIHMP